MTESPAEYARVVRETLALISAEDADRLVPELPALAEMVDDHWGWEHRKVIDAVRAPTNGSRDGWCMSSQAGYLPYEGDRVLAVILSKAMLPAADTKITDPTILRRL